MLLVNSCCPGYVNMTKHRGSKMMHRGTQTPVLLALRDVKDVYWESWQHEKVIEW